MANWTVSSYSNAETQGDNVNAGSMAAYADLVITPNVGYVISATDFKIGGATESPTNTWTGGNVDTEVYKVVFSDIGTAGTVSNTVRARVHFDSTALGGTPWNMPSNNETIYIDIDEKTTVENIDRYFCIRTQHVAETDGKGVNKHTVTYATAPTGVTTTNYTPLIHNIGDGSVEHSHQGTVPQGAPAPGTLIFSVDFDAEENFGYSYVSEPTVGVLSGPYASYYTFQSSGHVYDSDNNLIFVTIKGYYDPPVGIIGLDPDPAGSAGAMCELGQSISISHVIRQAPQGEPGSTKQVTNVLMDISSISSNGEVRTIKTLGDAYAEFTLKIVSSDSSKTYDFGPVGDGVNGTFTASATESDPNTIGTNLGSIDYPVHFPPISSNTYYDIIITPITPTTATSNVPTAANELRIYQYSTVDVTLGLDDSANVYDDGELFDGDPNAVGGVKITGTGGRTVHSPITREFSYKIIPAMITTGSGTLNVKSSLDFDLDNKGQVRAQLNGEATGASFEVNSTVGMVVGGDISWSVQKTSMFTETTDSLTPLAYGGTPTTAPDLDNLVVGMQLTSYSVPARDNVTITSIDTGDNTIHLSDRVRMAEQEPLTFTTKGITVNSVHANGTTLEASQTMAGVQDDFYIDVGGGVSDLEAFVSGITVTKVVNDIIIAGTFEVHSFPTADTTVKLDLNELITIS